jgi:hypothetical protein
MPFFASKILAFTGSKRFDEGRNSKLLSLLLEFSCAIDISVITSKSIVI